MGSETFMFFNWRLYTDEDISAIEEIITLPDWNRHNTSLSQRLQAIYENAKQRFVNSYLESWYSDEDGDPEPCNARSTNYCASMAGAFINNAIRKICDSRSTTSTNITFSFPSLMISSETDYERPIRNSN